jgi:membrane protein required for colicin V production
MGENMPVTVLDAIVIVVVLISAILAMVRGFVREVLSIASWAAAAAAAYFFHGPLVPMVEPLVPVVAPNFESGVVATIIAAAIVFFIALIVASYITMRIADFVIDSRIGAVDRMIGFLFGAVRGALLLIVAFIFFDWAVPDSPDWVTQAGSKPFLESSGQRLIAVMPEDFEAMINNFLHPGDDSGSSSAPSTNTGDRAATTNVDYGSGTRQGLDQLIENTGAARQ